MMHGPINIRKKNLWNNAVNAVWPTIWVDLTFTIPERGDPIYINLLNPEVHQNKI